MSPVTADLPIVEVLPDLLRALADHVAVVLEAPPGAGKTTGVPLALHGQAWLADQKILMLEPRRLAARAAATRMASLCGEPVGGLIGYRTRLDSKVSAATRIEVVTEGILTRLLQDDPGLDGIGAVLFDEFHERSLHADLGLALCLESQGQLRPDLRILVMSATLDGAPIADLLGDAPIIASAGKSHPVSLHWLDSPPSGRFDEAMERLIRQALAEQTEGDLLAFLPGQAEIRRVQSRLEDRGRDDWLVLPLFGELSAEDQDRALARHPQRKIILATAIAETSLTIDGVRIVVDGGQMRQPRFDPNGGMTRLVTLPVSRASATQRAGRAGRTAPGACYRLWTAAEDRALAAFSTPEILAADLAPLALELARWGVPSPDSLRWLDPPPAASYAQAQSLLRALTALDGDGRLTPHGRRMAELPLHPRLAHMLLVGRQEGLGSLACDLAALLSERDPLRQARDVDLRLRIEALQGRPPANSDRGTLQRIRLQADHLRRRLAVPLQPGNSGDVGRLLAQAYPDRVALRRAGQGLQFRMSNGRGAVLPEVGPLANAEALAIAELDGDRRESRIFLAAPLTRSEIETDFAGQITTEDVVVWDSREELVTAVRRQSLNQLVLRESKLTSPPPETIAAAMLAGVASLGLACLPWSDAARGLQQRVAFLHRLQPGDWPDLSDDHLAASLADWLLPWLDGVSRRSHLDRLDMSAILRNRLNWDQQQALDRLAPTHLTVPSGSRVAIDYSQCEQPVLAVRLQEMFGLAETPRIADGRVPLLLHLLSPARRPVQVTQDLASFWANAYRAVKADLKGQYPKHYWPDNPLDAEPTARAKPRR